MNANNYTQKTLEALQTAQAMAQENSNNYIAPEHMLYALAALFCLYDSKDFAINDGDDVKAFFAAELPFEKKYEAFVRNESFWGMDLEATEGVYTASVDYVRAIKAGKVRETLKTL